MYFKKLFLLTALCVCSSVLWSQGTGCIKGNCQDGFGIYSWSNNDQYKGYWSDGKFNGKGSFYWADGRTYEGDWLENKKHGEGKFQWNDGAMYSGFWDNDKKNGLGLYSWPTGEKYAGEWKLGKKHGLGAVLSNKGRIVQEGVYINDKFKYTQEFLPRDNNLKKINPEPFKTDRLVSSGTGFAVSYFGHLITNHHVINGCEKVTIKFNEKSELTAKILAIDSKQDLALLKINKRPLSVLAIDEEGPQLLNEIFVAGYPFGNSISTSIKITKGIISSMKGLGDDNSNIQIDAAIQPGNSGGPILNNEANIVGVAVSKLDAVKVLEDTGSIPENINFGIKSNIVSKFLTSNSVNNLPKPNNTSISNKELSSIISNATYFVSCVMNVN